MSDEFDEISEGLIWKREVGSGLMAPARTSVSAPRLVSRLYAAAKRPLRARLLACLLQPLGPLGLAGVAAGTFSVYLQRDSAADIRVAVEDVAQYSKEQIFELARFTEQVDPQALRQFAGLISDNAPGIAEFSAPALVLLDRAVRSPSYTPPESPVS